MAADARAQLLAIKKGAENKGTVKHRMAVVKQFNDWRKERPVSADLILEFLTANITSGDYKPPTMWSRRSHLASYYTLEHTPPIDFSAINPLLDAAFKVLFRGFCCSFFLKNTNNFILQALDKAYVPKHAKEFTVQQLFDFWARADNEGEMLRAKAVSIIGFFGLARTSELVGLKWSDVEERPDGVVVRLQRKKCAQDGARDPVLIPRCHGHRIVPADVFLAYKASVLAAPPQKDNRMWRRWDSNKKRWLAQPLGINKLKEIPKLIATFLGLSPNGYRGHSWRPSGATALATNGGTAAQLQTAGHWASLGVAQQYIHAGPEARAAIADVLVGPDSQEDGDTQESPAPAPQPGPPPSKIQRTIIFNAPLINCHVTINGAQP